MDVLTYTDARKNLKSVMDRVVGDCSQVVVTRRNGEPVVMLSLAEWNSIEETNYLISNRKNADRLRRGIEQFESGDGNERELLKP